MTALRQQASPDRLPWAEEGIDDGAKRHRQFDGYYVRDAGAVDSERFAAGPIHPAADLVCAGCELDLEPMVGMQRPYALPVHFHHQSSVSTAEVVRSNDP